MWNSPDTATLCCTAAVLLIRQAADCADNDYDPQLENVKVQGV